MLIRLLLLSALFTSFLAGGISAQTSRNEIDSADACKAVGGNWQSGDTLHRWREICMLKGITEKECYAKGGYLIMGGKIGEIRPCGIPMSIDATRAQCVSKGGKWGAHCRRFEHCFFEKDEQACVSSGGYWTCSPSPFASEAYCLRIATDAGKSCKDSRECTYGCDYLGGAIGPDSEVEGKCRAENTSAGCRTAVIGGRIGGSICAD